MQNTIGAINPIEEAVDLGAQFTLRIGVLRITAHLDRDAIFYRHFPSTGVGAIVMTGT